MADQRYRALLIGNSDFPQDSHNLRRLEGPVNDVHALASALKHPQCGLFAPDDVRLVVERPMPLVLEELDRYFQAAHRDDVLLLYYSGHGVLDERNHLHLCTRDTRTDALLSTSVSNLQINAMLEQSAASSTVILLDCCYSGAFKGGNIPASLRGSGRYVLSSCRGSELANDATQLNHTSLFTQHVVDGLLGAAPDANRDGYVGLSDLYEYVHAQLQAQGRQIPQRDFAGGGDVAIALRPADPLGPEQSGPPRERTPRSTLVLSETVIDLRDVRPNETLPPEHIEVSTTSGERPDWVASTDADWIDLEQDDQCLTLRFHPHVGTNRGNVVVCEQGTGVKKFVRVHVGVTREPVDPQLQVWPARVDFGAVRADQRKEATIRVENAGGGRLDWEYLPSGEFFTADRSGQGVRLALLDVPGSHTGTVTINSNAGSLTVPITAEIRASCPPADRRVHGSMSGSTAWGGMTALDAGPDVGEPLERTPERSGRSGRGRVRVGSRIAALLLVLAGCLLYVSTRHPPAQPTGASADVGVATPAKKPSPAASSPTTPARSPSPPSATVNAALSRDVTPLLRVDAPPPGHVGTDAGGTRTTFFPKNMLDGVPATAYRTDDDATGAVLIFTLPSRMTVTQVGLVNGYAKIDPVNGDDRYLQNRRLLQVTWVFDSGVARRQELISTRSLQTLDLPGGIPTSRVELHIDRVSGHARGYDHTAISDVRVLAQ